MKARQVIGMLLMCPAALMLFYALAMYLPGVVMGMGLTAAVWAGVELMKS